MRAWALALAALTTAACGTDRCKAGTVLLSVALDNGAEAATAIDLTLSVDGAPPQMQSVAHTPGSRSGTIEVDFTGAYPSGRSLAFTLAARAGAQPIATAVATLTATAGCGNVPMTLDGNGGAGDLAGDLASDDGPSDLGGVDLGPIATARLLAPLSTATVTSQRPTLRWALVGGGGTPVVDLCKDRGCTQPLTIATTVGSGNDSATPDAPLPHGWLFWRVRVTLGANTTTSPVWQLWVGASGTSVDASSGTILDVNGDGYADFLVGAAKLVAHLYLGNGTGAPMQRIDLTNPDGNGSSFGDSVASAGDVNGDGYADFLVGAEMLGGSGGPGAAHLFLGEATPNASDYNGATAARRIDLPGPDPGIPAYGDVVRSVGDVDGDGYADFVVGAGNANVAHIYFGSAAPSAADWGAAASARRIDVTSPDGASGQFGSAAAGAGDVNGDGYGDFLVGALAAGSNLGAAHLYYGGSAPTAAGWNGVSPPERVDLVSPDGSSGSFGGALASAGDIDGDGYSDFLVGATGANSLAGAAHLYRGQAMPTTAGWNGATAPKRIDLTGPNSLGRFGVAVSGAGDVNGDGYSDFLIGDYAAASGGVSTGAAHQFLGEATPFAADWNGATPPRRLDLTCPDTTSQANFGASVSVGGDVDGDGYADVLVGEPGAAADSGAAHLYFGKTTPVAATDYNGATPGKRVDFADPDGASAGFGASVF
jgi:hypothetical protein